MTTDGQWLRHIMSSYAQDIMNFIRFYTRTTAETEDLTQEVFLKAFRARHSFQEKSQVKTWLWRITIRVCQDYLRRQRRRPVHYVDDLDHGTLANSAETEAMDSIQSTELLECVRSLPEKYQTVILLFYFEGLDIRETAQTLQISATAVKTRLFRARNALKEIITRQGGENCEAH